MLNTQLPSVAEIAATSPAAVRLFERYGIDSCRGGHRPIAEVCAAKGIDPVVFEWDLEAAMKEAPAGEPDRSAARPAELIQHIVEVHHGYLRRELPATARRVEKVHRIYNQRYGPTLTGLPEAFGALQHMLYEHMQKEEDDLFLAVETCDLSGGTAAASICARLRDPGALRSLRIEHEMVGDLLSRIRIITEDFRVPAHGCTTYRALMNGLLNLDRDLRRHMHLENSVLYPRITELASTLQ